MKVTLKQLEIFHAIIVAGSISQATRMVGLSQPTLSQQLAKFEETLGTQLIVRGRSANVKLTAAGEYWFRNASQILNSVDKAEQQHRILFTERNLTLSFGTTPSLRGRFTEVAARCASEIEQIARFEMVWGTTSNDVVEMINTHKLNCGIVSLASVEPFRSSFHIEHLWTDPIAWTLPAHIPDKIIESILATGALPAASPKALSRYVDLTEELIWSEWSENWFRHRLPFATPFFGCMALPTAVDIVAAGLATCHTPVSLISNLPESVRSRIKIVDLGEYRREVVLVTPKHLMSLKPFKAFCDKMTSYTRAAYGNSAELPKKADSALGIANLLSRD